MSDGGYGARLDTKGPPEFAALARGFNHMAARLETYSDSNQRLQRQILSIQEEERAGIARDLHDEVGPYLFAIQVDANAVAKSADPDVRALGGAIRQAALHIQQHVKEILRQLRPVGSLDFGLEAAIADLVAFWSRRHPAIRFERAIASDPQLDRAGEDAAYRIVQESLSNAMRHGRAAGDPHHGRGGGGSRCRFASRMTAAACNGPVPAGMSLGRMGLTGMEERLRALGGRLMIEETQELGVRVRAFIPKVRKLEIA